jgi:signal transduction histidine kinase
MAGTNRQLQRRLEACLVEKQMNLALVTRSQSTRASTPSRLVENARDAADRVALRTSSILAWMVIAIALVTALAYWDEERESQAALDDFAHEQTTLAVSLSAGLGDKLTVLAPELALAAARSIERPGSVRVFLARSTQEGFIASDGAIVRSPLLELAVAQTKASYRLSRADAAALGLPSRTAIAGLHAIDAAAGRWTVVVVATARAERDRELRARWRLVLGVVVTSGLVLAFGGLALRTQRKELELAHQLVLTTLRTERDERLVRADKLATMGALATGIAHEVSTPLGVILGRAEQLLPKQTDDRARRAVEAITAQTERIHVVIRGFLALARGRQPALEHCEPDSLAHAAMDLVEHRFEKAGVHLSNDIAKALPKVPCDPRLFEQVLVNLLLNACDACDEGGLVTLSIRADEKQVVFAVTDDGHGISAGAAERVTEPFFTTKPAGEGTGLGLAIASEIVKHHYGSLTLGPRRDGPGTRACVELPAAPTDDHA